MGGNGNRAGRRALRALTTVMAALVLAASVGLAGCGQDSPQRTDFDKVIAPERCGGSGGGPC